METRALTTPLTRHGNAAGRDLLAVGSVLRTCCAIIGRGLGADGSGGERITLTGEDQLMDYGIGGRTGLVLGQPDAAATACEEVLNSEGVRIVALDDAERADIVIAIARAHPGSDVLAVSLDDLYGSWNDVVDTIAVYHRALPHMQAQRWGRFVWVGTAASRSLDADQDDLNMLATLGMRALHKVIGFDEGPANVLANTVLRGSDTAADEVAAAVAFLCSEGSGYLTGVTLTVDGGVGSSVF
jgi:NAD(P)-dependent dehydrogenase (short-subunit alcohol dehydrogenase family)